MVPIVMTFKGAPEERLDNSKLLANAFNGEVYIGTADTVDNLYRIALKAKSEGLLLLEDDVIGYDKDLILSTIETNKDKIVNFNYSKLGTIDGSKYIYNQCVYLPPEFLDKLIEDRHYVYTHQAYYVTTKQHDLWIADLMRRNKLSFLSVGGRILTNFKSTLGHDNGTSD